MKCHRCKRTIVGPKLVVGGLWTCSTCVYYADMGMPNPNVPENKGRQLVMAGE